MFIVQPGIYYVSGGDVKTRGVERGRINQKRDDFEACWKRFLDSHGENHTVSVEVSNFITARQALARRNWNLCGHWEHDTRDISFDWGTKRQRTMAFHDGRAMRTIPYRGSSKVMSAGYDRLIGGEIYTPSMMNRWKDPGLIEKERMEEQPDWVEPLISD
jgi:hypothetical protein